MADVHSLTAARRTINNPPAGHTVAESDLVERIRDAQAAGLKHRRFGAYRIALAYLCGSFSTVAPEAARALGDMSDAFHAADVGGDHAR